MGKSICIEVCCLCRFAGGNAPYYLMPEQHCCSRSSCLKLMDHSQHASKMQSIGSVLGALSLVETQHAESIGSVLGVFCSYC